MDHSSTGSRRSATEPDNPPLHPTIVCLKRELHEAQCAFDSATSSLREDFPCQENVRCAIEALNMAAAHTVKALAFAAAIGAETATLEFLRKRLNISHGQLDQYRTMLRNEAKGGAA